MSLLSNLTPLNVQRKTVVIGVSLVILSISHASVAYFSYDYGKNAVKNDQLVDTINTMKEAQKELVSQQETFNNSVADLNTKLTNHSQTVKIITTNTEKEIEKPVYRDTIVPSSGMQLLSENATNLNSKRVSRSGTSEVQATSSTKEK